MKRKVHLEWFDYDSIDAFVKPTKIRTGKTLCGKKAFGLLISGKSLAEVTCKRCQQVYDKCERLGYWNE